MRGSSAVLIALAVAAAAGCLGVGGGAEVERSLETVPADPSDEDRSEREFWMVWIHGNQTREAGNPPVCTWARTHEVKPASASVWIAEEALDVEPEELRVLVAFDHMDHSTGCPAAHAIHANPNGTVTEEMGGYGELAVSVDEDGTVTADGVEAELGEAVQGTYETSEGLEGTFRAENMGAWHVSHVETS